MWLAKPKVSTVWPSIEKVCHLLIYSMTMTSKFISVGWTSPPNSRWVYSAAHWISPHECLQCTSVLTHTELLCSVHLFMATVFLPIVSSNTVLPIVQVKPPSITVDSSLSLVPHVQSCLRCVQILTTFTAFTQTPFSLTYVLPQSTNWSCWLPISPFPTHWSR